MNWWNLYFGVLVIASLIILGIFNGPWSVISGITIIIGVSQLEWKKK